MSARKFGVSQDNNKELRQDDQGLDFPPADHSSQERLLPPKSMVAFSESEGEEYVQVG